MATLRETGTGRLTSLDPRVLGIRTAAVRPDPDGSADLGQPGLTLCLALAAAAREASRIVERCGSDPARPEVMRRIDGEATRAAEAVLENAPFSIRVTAGEGERDESPGAVVGQVLGTAAGAPRYDGVFDYVDGTTLAAARAPGALSLGGFGQDIRSVPDLVVYAVLVPTAAVGDVDVMGRADLAVDRHTAVVARALGRRHDELVVATYTPLPTVSAPLVERLRGVVGDVIVTDPVIIEPPYILSLLGLTRRRVDTVIGFIGLSELAFAALLLDLALPDFAFVFRLGSLDATKAPGPVDFHALFRFSERELAAYAASGWDVGRQYVTHDIVPAGRASAAGMFAVTQNTALALPGPRAGASSVAVDGLLLEPGGRVLRVTVDAMTSDE